MFYFPKDSPKRGTVSDFQEWVWAKHDKKMQEWLWYRQHPEMRSGRRQEEDKENLFRMAYSKLHHDKVRIASNVLQEIQRINIQKSPWKVVYKDIHDDKPKNNSLNSKSLYVDDNPLRGCPDIVFENQISREILIVETKIIFVPLDMIPEETYPNIRAQLWCYSKMGFWEEINDDLVSMVVNFWDVTLKNYRISRIWKRSDDNLNKECSDWFNAYQNLRTT